jgi:hypothetical protein
VTFSEGAVVAAIVFVSALLQVTLFATLDVAGGVADVLLLALVSIALLRGAVVGSVAGFFGGLLVDVLTLDTLGVSALRRLRAPFPARRGAFRAARARRDAAADARAQPGRRKARLRPLPLGARTRLRFGPR